MSKPKVYLAGPDVFLPEPEKHVALLKAACVDHGLEGVFPLDVSMECPDCDEGSVHSPTAQPGYEYRACSTCGGTGSLATPEKIFETNLGLIRSCQGVLANMTPFRGPSADVGTGWEMGFAYGLGIPVIGYTSNPHHYYARVGEYRSKCVKPLFDDFETIEDFNLQDNLMLTCSTLKILPNIEKAAEAMKWWLYFGRKP